MLNRVPGRLRDALEPAMSTAVDGGRRARRVVRQRVGGTTLDRLSDDDVIDLAYESVLGRPADPGGRENYERHLAEGTLRRDEIARTMMSSDEFWFGRVLTQGEGVVAIHRSRCLFVQQLPQADRILDLGGTHQSSVEGAFISLGYPYEFERLVIVDLPPGERHELYGYMTSDEPVDTRLGPVEYSFHSMADLSAFDDDSFDLVYSGQTFEHVPEDVGDVVLAEVARVLRPGGWFALDTPNGAATRFQLEGTGLTVTNPDHDIEYEHAALRDKLEAAGFVIDRQFGLTHLPRTFAEQRYVPEELETVGLYDDIERSYLLAYVCRLP